MDNRIMFVALGVAALALAGIAFAAGGQGWNVTGVSHQDWNGTLKGHGMMRGLEGNGTRILNRTAMAQERASFQQAVLADDYSTAKNLSGEYGFGGPLFGKLNETTFAKYSQIANLESQLRQELGLNGTGMMPMMGNPGPKQFANGFRAGEQMGFVKGMRHGIRQTNQDTNQTQQQ